MSTFTQTNAPDNFGPDMQRLRGRDGIDGRDGVDGLKIIPIDESMDSMPPEAVVGQFLLVISQDNLTLPVWPNEERQAPFEFGSLLQIVNDNPFHVRYTGNLLPLQGNRTIPVTTTQDATEPLKAGWMITNINGQPVDVNGIVIDSQAPDAQNRYQFIPVTVGTLMLIGAPIQVSIGQVLTEVADVGDIYQIVNRLDSLNAPDNRYRIICVKRMSIKGSKGDIGATGATGPIGLQGDIGGSGATGATGNINELCPDLPTLQGIVQRVALGEYILPISVLMTNTFDTMTGVGIVEPGSLYMINNTNGALISRGSIGSSGATGPIGPVGGTGNTGSIGPMGATGLQGVMGATGNIGPIGSTGPEGASVKIYGVYDTGANLNASTTTVRTPGAGYIVQQTGTLWVWDGSQGLGATGIPPGEFIDTGAPMGVGATGSLGATGATGASGYVGATGASGVDGMPGAQGATGASGMGATGASGSLGFQGSAGATGPVGATGATGIGIQGATGIGATGWNGATGATGLSVVGATGETGATGVPAPGNIYLIPMTNVTATSSYLTITYPPEYYDNNLFINGTIAFNYNNSWVNINIFNLPIDGPRYTSCLITQDRMYNVMTTTTATIDSMSFAIPIITVDTDLSPWPRLNDSSAFGHNRMVPNIISIVSAGSITLRIPSLANMGTAMFSNLRIDAGGQTGATGPIGPQGATGQGATGTIGATGATGPMGASGLQGGIGSTGYTGGPGATGATGPMPSGDLVGINTLDGLNAQRIAMGIDGNIDFVTHLDDVNQLNSVQITPTDINLSNALNVPRYLHNVATPLPGNNYDAANKVYVDSSVAQFTRTAGVDTATSLYGVDLQAAIDALPYTLNYTATFNLYNSNPNALDLSGFVGSGAVVINGNGFNACTLGLHCDSSLCEMTINNCTVQGPIEVLNSSYVEFTQCTLTSTQPAQVTNATLIFNGTTTVAQDINAGYNGKLIIDDASMNGNLNMGVGSFLMNNGTGINGTINAPHGVVHVD